MLFNSIDFAIFLPIVFILYWFFFHKNLQWQNALLLVASYIFYGWWDWRFLSLIIFSSIVDYFVGIGLSKTDNKKNRKLLLLTSIFVNLGFLGIFKYYNFFLDTFVEAFSFLGYSINPQGLNIILPVGISFYTFQTLSYSIDVYKRKLESTKNIVAFFAFISFFPQLVAGPIERAKNLLPQFYTKRIFKYDNAIDGARQILWGLFKKIVIADNCSKYANLIFNNSTDYSGCTLLLGVVFFAFQIYGDFSGYSDIAIGTARLFGFNLMQNFAFPYFSRDIAEFWRRWHISLSTWFRDYVYIPLGGNKGNVFVNIRNVFVIFIVSGLWHGANWTFIVWGALNAMFFLPLLLMNKHRKYTDIPSIKEFFQIISTFVIILFGWVFFRANNINHALSYLNTIFSLNFFQRSISDIKQLSNGIDIIYPLVFICILIIIEWFQRDKKHALQNFELSFHQIIRWAIYYGIISVIILFGGAQQEFIYFQF